MIENLLQPREFERLLRAFIRMLPPNECLDELRKVIGIPADFEMDIVCQDKILVSFRGYRIQIRDLREIRGAMSVSIEFKAKKKWWHGLFGDQNKALLHDLKNICISEVEGLKFESYEKMMPSDELTNLESARLEFLYDSRALNEYWDQGRDISPLLIAPDCHHGNCFVEFHLNSGAYFRQGGKTRLRDDWMDCAFAVSDCIDESAKRLLGITDGARPWENERSSRPAAAKELRIEGNACRRTGQFEDAIKALRMAAIVAPDKLIYCDLGLAYEALGRDDEAMDSFSRATEFGPKYAPAYHNLGWICGKLGRHEEELDAYRLAVRFAPKSSGAMLGIADALASLCRYDEAREAYRRAIGLVPDNVDAHFGFGLMCALLGDRSLASEECVILKELDKERADELLQRILRGTSKNPN
jgi:tetratricopeptide (TPR) repeat protein